MAYAMKHQGQITATSSLDIVAGCWLFLSPFFLPYRSVSSAVANTVSVGLVIAVLAAYHLAKPVRASWASWVNAVLGVWLLISPWVLGFSHVTSATYNSVVIGIFVILLATWNSIATYDRDSTAP
jgi:ABC-type molybdate transport system permease subunit